MALSNHGRVGKGLELLTEGLRPFVEGHLEAKYGKYWITVVTEGSHIEPDWVDDDTPHLDAALLLRLMWEQWNEVFRYHLGFTERSLVSELREARNKWAHQMDFTSRDAHRAIDSMARLLTAIAAPQADALEREAMDLMRLMFEEQARGARRRAGGTAATNESVAGLKPWRQVITPHQDVSSGRYQNAEFAADLWQVYRGEGSPEYRDPEEFFRRTFLTASLEALLGGAMQRLAGQGGDPVVQLQTNFGGGKTHSMLALYHLFGGGR